MVLVIFFGLLDLFGLSWVCVLNILSSERFIADWQGSYSMNDMSFSESKNIMVNLLKKLRYYLSADYQYLNDLIDFAMQK